MVRHRTLHYTCARSRRIQRWLDSLIWNVQNGRLPDHVVGTAGCRAHAATWNIGSREATGSSNVCVRGWATRWTHIHGHFASQTTGARGPTASLTGASDQSYTTPSRMRFTTSNRCSPYYAWPQQHRQFPRTQVQLDKSAQCCRTTFTTRWPNSRFRMPYNALMGTLNRTNSTHSRSAQST